MVDAKASRSFNTFYTIIVRKMVIKLSIELFMQSCFGKEFFFLIPWKLCMYCGDAVQMQ